MIKQDPRAQKRYMMNSAEGHHNVDAMLGIGISGILPQKNHFVQITLLFNEMFQEKSAINSDGVAYILL